MLIPVGQEVQSRLVVGLYRSTVGRDRWEFHGV